MACNNPSGPIAQEALKMFRYAYGITVHGKSVLLDTLNWLYQGRTASYKEYITNTLNISNSVYKKIFDRDQRAKLDGGNPAQTYDVSLIYHLLQLTCGLSEDESVWTSEDLHNPTLEHSLYKVKALRNIIAHENLSLSQQDLNHKLTELEQIYHTIYDLAGVKSGQPLKNVDQLKAKVTQNMASLHQQIREQLDPAEYRLLQKEIQHCIGQLKAEVEVKAKEELYIKCEPLCEVQPAPWLLIPGLSAKPSVLYTKITLKRESTLSTPVMMDMPEQEVQSEDILHVKQPNGTLAPVIIVTANGGMGKSTLLRYILEAWMTNRATIKDLDRYKIILYAELRYHHIRSFDDLLQNLLINTQRETAIDKDQLRSIILDLPTLILLDGFDEHNKASRQLINEVLHLPSISVRVIITTRPSHTVELNRLIHVKSTINIVIEGIHEGHHQDFVKKLVGVLSPRDQQIYQRNIVQQLPRLRQELGEHLNSPLILSLLVVTIVKCPAKINALTTNTRLLEEFTYLINEKLVDRLQLKGIEDAEYKCSQFIVEYKRVAFNTYKNREFELNEETKIKLIHSCTALGLPPDDVLSSWFTLTVSRDDAMHLGKSVKFFHPIVQEHASSGFLVHEIVKNDLSSANICQLLFADSDGELGQNSDADQDYDSVSSKHRFSNVLSGATGLLKINYPHLMVKYAPYILDHVYSKDEIGYHDVNPVMSHIIEGESDPSVIKAVAWKLEQIATKAAKIKWVIQHNSLKAVSTVLDHTKPTYIRLLIKTELQELQHLESSVKSITHATIPFALDLETNWNDNYSSSSDTLKMVQSFLQQPGKEDLLQEFRGSLRGPTEYQLPKSLTVLRLRVDPVALDRFVQELPNLPNLDCLVVLLDDPVCCPSVAATFATAEAATSSDLTNATLLPELQYQGRSFVLAIPGVINDSAAVMRSADLAAQVWPQARPPGTVNVIAFPVTHLTYEGAMELLKTLADQRRSYIEHQGKLREQEKILMKQEGDLRCQKTFKEQHGGMEHLWKSFMEQQGALVQQGENIKEEQHGGMEHLWKSLMGQRGALVQGENLKEQQHGGMEHLWKSLMEQQGALVQQGESLLEQNQGEITQMLETLNVCMNVIMIQSSHVYTEEQQVELQYLTYSLGLGKFVYFPYVE